MLLVIAEQVQELTPPGLVAELAIDGPGVPLVLLLVQRVTPTTALLVVMLTAVARVELAPVVPVVALTQAQPRPATSVKAELTTPTLVLLEPTMRSLTRTVLVVAISVPLTTM